MPDQEQRHVALTQTASAFPFFLLALPAGALGDIFDRRKLILTTEVWMFSVAVVLAVLTVLHFITPWALLLLTLALSIRDARSEERRVGEERRSRGSADH